MSREPLLERIKKTVQARRRLVWLASRSASIGFPLLPAHKSLAGLHKKHAGKRVFIVGNGPSLRMEDLTKIHDHHEFSMGSNRIFKAFSQTPWRPSYYLCVDKLLEQDATDLVSNSDSVGIFPTYFSDAKHPRIHRVRIFNDEYAVPWPRFSGNAFAGVFQGFTVTYIAIQMAVFMGFREIYLLGVDHNYTLAADKAPVREVKGLKVFEKSTEQNYFLPDYHQTGDCFFQPKPDENELAYQAAERHQSQYGFRVFNATRGGNLEVFERVPFDSLF